MLSLPPAPDRRQAIRKWDIPAEIDRAEVELSPLHPSSPSKRHGSPRHHGSPQLSRRGPDAPATDHQARARMVWGPSMAPSDSQIAPRNGLARHAMQRAMQCSTAQSLVRCGFGFAFGLKSGMGRRGEVPVPTSTTEADTACLPTCQSTVTRRPLRSRLPGMVLHAHVAFRFRSA